MSLSWLVGFVALSLGDPLGSKACEEQVDLIELNHFHDCLGRHVYDQVIFYEWSPEKMEFHVRAWCLVEEREPTSRRPVRSYANDLYNVRWHDRDQNLQRSISSRHFRESWTQVDPERANKKVLDERQRTALAKRRLDPSKTPVESLETIEPIPEATLAQSDLGDQAIER
jgi:hypothetical protein